MCRYVEEGRILRVEPPDMRAHTYAHARIFLRTRCAPPQQPGLNGTDPVSRLWADNLLLAVSIGD